MLNTLYKVFFTIFLAFFIVTGISAVTVVINVIVLLSFFGIHLSQEKLGFVICERLKDL